MSTPRAVLESLSHAGILDLHDKVRAGARLDASDGMRLFACPDLAAVGYLANIVRERLHGNLCWYNRNLHVNATNVCEASCIFCSFARLETGDPNAWTMSYDEALDRIKVLDNALVTEVHIVNGLNPDLPYDYYLELMRRIKAHRPDIHVKGFTAVEIHYYAEKYDMTVAKVLQTMRGAGLDSMPGGGAEIFADRARKKLCHDKVDAQGWLDIHAEAHRQGIFTNCTMLFGSIETLEERVDHLLRLRDLQDRSLRDGAMLPDHGGAHFQTFIPLRFHNDNNRLARLASPTGYDSLRTIAVARLMLDNIPHIKAYWPMLGTDEAQAALWYGASDLDGTVREEHIYHMAGAETPQGLSPDDLVRFIRHAGRTPAERDTLYNVVSRKDAPPALAPSPTPTRVGWVDYSNARPLVTFLSGLDLVGGHPSEVASALSRGEIDLALLPVGALLSDAAQADRRGYRVVPDVCIGCDGDVHSVLMVADTPPEQWTEVRLDGVSRTSVLLARLLLTHPDSPLAQRMRPDLKLTDAPPTTGQAGAGGTVAALVIGDAAHRLGDRFPQRVDLGGAWKAWTGLPFVFAVWAGRAHVPPAVVDHIRAAGLAGIAGVKDGSLLVDSTPADRTYLTEHIRYPLDDRAMMGMRRFASLAFRAGLVQRETFTLYPPDTTIQRPDARRISDILDGAADGAPLTGLALARVYRNAPLVELQLASARRRGAAQNSDRASYVVRGHAELPVVQCTREGTPELPSGPWVAELVFGDEGDDDLPARIDTLARQPGLVAVGARPAPSTTAGVSTHNNTATHWLRLLATLRLVMPDSVHVLSSWEHHGRGLGQLALRGGADDLGEVLPNGTADQMQDGVWPMTVREAERLLRLAGFVPQPRDGSFAPLGAARTAAESTDRPLRRLDSRGST